MAKSRTNCDEGKSVAGGTEVGRRDWTSTAESDNSKIYLSRRFRSKHRFRKPHWICPVEMVTKQRARGVLAFTGHPWTHRLDLELVFWAALTRSFRCLSLA